MRQNAVMGSCVGYFGTLIRKVRPCSMLLKMVASVRLHPPLVIVGALTGIELCQALQYS
jgi:hypothetical protein